MWVISLWYFLQSWTFHTYPQSTCVLCTVFSVMCLVATSSTSCKAIVSPGKVSIYLYYCKSHTHNETCPVKLLSPTGDYWTVASTEDGEFAPASLTSMSHFSPWTMQTLIWPVFVLVLPLCHAAWGCLTLFNMAHLPTLQRLRFTMPIFTSEWGRALAHFSTVFPRLFSHWPSSLSRCVSPLTGSNHLSLTQLSDLGG